MPKLKPQPSQELLDKIEEIGNIKRELSLADRSLTSGSGLYVQSGRAPFAIGGITKYTAGGGKTFASLVFLRERDGTRSVRKYKPGDWELKVDETLSFCRLLHRAARVPEGWPPDKIAAYSAKQVGDADLLARGQQAYREHREELSVVWKQGSVEERHNLFQLFWRELEEEWPVEYLEASLQKKGEQDVVAEASLDPIMLAWGFGYMLGKGWISGGELAEVCLQLGWELAEIVRSRFKRAKCRAAGFAGAFSAVVARGTAQALAEKEQ